MVRFFTIEDNSFYNRGLPWVNDVVSGAVQDANTCPSCGASTGARFKGDLHVTLEPGVGREWPNILGCANGLFIVSQGVLLAWNVEGIEDVFVGGRIHFESPVPKMLTRVVRPVYYWLNNVQMIGASLHDEDSGFVGTCFCPLCGKGTFDADATYSRQHSRPWSYVFVDGSWSGVDLFTADSNGSGLGGGSFYCTKRVVECARNYGLTNFRFVPCDADQRHALAWGGVEYLGGKWPPEWYPPSPSAGKSIDGWLKDLACGDHQREYAAVCAVEDLGDKAVPGLVKLLDSKDERKALKASGLLGNRNDLDDETRQVITKIYRDWVTHIAKEYGAGAMNIFRNELKTGPEIKQDEIRQYLR